MPLFSVIIPTYGRPRFLDEALRSVLAQSVVDFEVIVVDDASPEPMKVVDDPRIQLHRRRGNGGPAAARNTGVRAATGTYVTFLDDDDCYSPDRLEIGLRGMEQADVSTCWVRYDDGSAGKDRLLNGDVADVIMDDINPHLGATTVRRSALLEFDETFRTCEDVEWWLRMAAKNTVATVPEVGLIRRRHDSERVGYGEAQRARDGARLIQQHGAYFKAHPDASAFRWKRVGMSTPDTFFALRALGHSFLNRREPKTILHMAVRMVPGGYRRLRARN